jgi:hypothetical protein
MKKRPPKEAGAVSQKPSKSDFLSVLIQLSGSSFLKTSYSHMPLVWSYNSERAF